MSDQSVLFIDDLARELRTSRSTIERRLRDGGRALPPQMKSPDKRPRWHRATVEQWMARTQTAHAFRMMHGGGR